MKVQQVLLSGDRIVQLEKDISLDKVRPDWSFFVKQHIVKVTTC